VCVCGYQVTKQRRKDEGHGNGEYDNGQHGPHEHGPPFDEPAHDRARELLPLFSTRHDTVRRMDNYDMGW